MLLKKNNNRFRAYSTYQAVQTTGSTACHTCYESILGKKDLKEFMESCDHMTDRKFQKSFIDSLFQFNGEIMRARRDYLGDKAARWSWIGENSAKR